MRPAWQPVGVQPPPKMFLIIKPPLCNLYNTNYKQDRGTWLFSVCLEEHGRSLICLLPSGYYSPAFPIARSTLILTATLFKFYILCCWNNSSRELKNTLINLAFILTNFKVSINFINAVCCKLAYCNK